MKPFPRNVRIRVFIAWWYENWKGDSLWFFSTIKWWPLPQEDNDRDENIPDLENTVNISKKWILPSEQNVSEHVLGTLRRVFSF